LNKRGRHAIYILLFVGTLPFLIMIFGVLLSGWKILPIGFKEIESAVVFSFWFIQIPLAVLGPYYMWAYLLRRVDYKLGGHRFTGVNTIIDGSCIIHDVPCAQYGVMVATQQGFLYTPGKTLISPNWTVYPLDEIVSVSVVYQSLLLLKPLHLSIKIQDGKTLQWRNRKYSHAGTLVKYLRENKYPLVEQSGGH